MSSSSWWYRQARWERRHIVTAGTSTSTDTIATVAGMAVEPDDGLADPTPRPHAGRRHDREPFVTGQRVLDVLEPIAKGSSATVIGGFGEGKTVLTRAAGEVGQTPT